MHEEEVDTQLEVNNDDVAVHRKVLAGQVQVQVQPEVNQEIVGAQLEKEYDELEVVQVQVVDHLMEEGVFY